MNELMAGKAGEHLVCFDLLTQGVEAFLSAQGLPFDVVALYKGATLKIQVKSCLKPRNSGKYIFSIRSGKGGARLGYDSANVDIMAFVSLDTREVAYVPIRDCGTIIEFMVSANRGNHQSEITSEKIRKALAIRRENPEMALEVICEQCNLSIHTFRKLYKREYVSRFELRYFGDYPLLKAVAGL